MHARSQCIVMYMRVYQQQQHKYLYLISTNHFFFYILSTTLIKIDCVKMQYFIRQCEEKRTQP